jgi:hypothetical protein
MTWRPLVVHRAGDPLDVGVVELDGGGLVVRWAHDGDLDEVETRGGLLYVVDHGWRLDPVTRRASYARSIRAVADAAWDRERRNNGDG